VKVEVKISDPKPAHLVRPAEVVETWARILTVEVEGDVIPTDMPALTETVQKIVTATINLAKRYADYGTVVVLSFRGPIYVHSAIANAIAGYFMAVAHYDPKVGAGVVAFPSTLAGSIVKIEEGGGERA
jgi:hypothetical protein